MSCCQFIFINPLDCQFWPRTLTARRGTLLSRVVPVRGAWLGQQGSHTCQAAGSGLQCQAEAALPDPVSSLGLINILWLCCCPGWLHWHGIQGAATPLTAQLPQLSRGWDSRAAQSSQCRRGSHNSLSERFSSSQGFEFQVVSCAAEWGFLVLGLAGELVPWAGRLCTGLELGSVSARLSQGMRAAGWALSVSLF